MSAKQGCPLTTIKYNGELNNVYQRVLFYFFLQILNELRKYMKYHVSEKVI